MMTDLKSYLKEMQKGHRYGNFVYDPHHSSLALWRRSMNSIPPPVLLKAVEGEKVSGRSHYLL